jgi:hypothetical protein
MGLLKTIMDQWQEIEVLEHTASELEKKARALELKALQLREELRRWEEDDD